MSDKGQKKYPAIKGLRWHRDQYYSFYIANDWHNFHWADDREGVIYGPDANDPYTIFAVDLKDLGTTITGDDLDIVAEGFFESIEQLPDCVIESRKQKVTGKLLELEAKYNPARRSLAMKHRYVNPMSGQQLDDLPAELLLLTTELHTVYAQIDLVWCRCLVNLVFTRPNRLKSSKAVFEFDGEVPEIFTAPSESS